ncbi:MAG TPA: HNH endonuclease [Candidatus Binatia bacterium]|nr:HNH endonuclease [Candidatus Binatia bacterium]
MRHRILPRRFQHQLDHAFLKATRSDKATAQNGRCFYCRWPMRTVTADHMVPRARFGKKRRWFADRSENIVAACAECNSLKADMRIGDFVRSVKKAAPGSGLAAVMARFRRRISIRLDKMDERLMRACGAPQ